jgi:hypothetical protein
MQAQAIQRYYELTKQFPQLQPIIDKLDAAAVPFVLGGSASLYIQGNGRWPHDIDLLFLPEAHARCNALFGLQPTHIERPTVSMQKSSAVKDNSIDFLSKFTMLVSSRSFHMPPTHKVVLKLENGRVINLVPVEKIVIAKLLGHRPHHQDFDDVRVMLASPSYNKAFFWELVDSVQARQIIQRLLHENNLVV